MDKSPATTASLLLRVPARHIAIALLLALAGCGMTTKEEIPVWQYRGPSTPSYEFGDPATGIVALLSLGSGRISGRGDAPGAGVIWIRESQIARPPGHERGDYAFTYQENRLVLPKRYLASLAIQLDGKPFSNAILHPILDYWNAGYWIDLPYVPDLVGVEVGLSTGERFRQKVRIPTDAPMNRNHDARREVNDVVRTITPGRPGRGTAKLHNQALLEIQAENFAENSGRLPLVMACVSSEDYGPISRIQLIQKPHPQLSSEEIVINATEFQEPVYSTFLRHTVKDIRPSIHDLYRGSPPTIFEFVFECETVKGKRFSHALRVNIPAIRAAEG